MNKTLSTIFICFLLIFGASDAKQVIRVPSVEAGNLIVKRSAPPVGDECEGFEICQNAEGPGYDNNEIWGGSADPDHTVIVLRGLESIEVGDLQNPVSPIFTAVNEFWAFLRWQCNDPLIDVQGYYAFSNNGGVGQVWMYWNTNQTASIHAGATTVHTTAVLDVDVTGGWCFWIHAKRGDGSNNGDVYVWYDTCNNVCNGTICDRSAAAGTGSAVGTANWDSTKSDVVQIEVYWKNFADRMILDQLLLNNEAFEDVND